MEVQFSVKNVQEFDRKCRGVCELMPFHSVSHVTFLGRVRFVLGYIVYEDFTMSKSDQRNHTKNPITCLYR